METIASARGWSGSTAFTRTARTGCLTSASRPAATMTNLNYASWPIAGSNPHQKGDASRLPNPALPKIKDKLLRAFPDALPADELNTRIDELFVPTATNALPQTASEFQSWRSAKLAELRRIVFR